LGDVVTDSLQKFSRFPDKYSSKTEYVKHYYCCCSSGVKGATLIVGAVGLLLSAN